MPPPLISLNARFVSLIWQAPDDALVIARCRQPNGEDVVVRGPADAGARFEVDLDYCFQGQWERHAKHGMQFAFDTLTIVQPHDRRGVIAYLMATAEGVGSSLAERLWDAFGADAVRVLRESPQQVADAGCLSLEAAREASQSLHDGAAFESVKIDLLTLFAGRGFQSGKLIKECLALWKRRAAEMVRKNPWLLLLSKPPAKGKDVLQEAGKRGLISCGYKRVDRLYLDLGGRKNALKRQALHIWHQLRSDGTGHTWHDAQQLAKNLAAAIPGSDPRRALILARRSGLLTRHEHPLGEKWLAESKKAFNESRLADKVKELLCCA